MMKKYLLLCSALFVLAACNSGNNDSKDSTTKSTAAATVKSSSVRSEKVIQVQVQIRPPLQARRLQRVHPAQIPRMAITGWRPLMN